MANIVAVALVLTMAWDEPTPTNVPFEKGESTYYAPGLMKLVASNRGIEIPNGYIPVALNRSGDVGRMVWVYFPRSGNLYPAISVDCAQSKHYKDRLALDRIVEVPASVAQQEGFYGIGPEPVEVWYTIPLHYFTFMRVPV